ncbi:MAG: hypothetical protein LC731_01335 [Acidobacteria bacterium]|nr:hypothetical protein [Acidobacteriota bacterium]
MNHNDSQHETEGKAGGQFQALARAAWFGFVGLIMGFMKENVGTPLKVNYQNRDCPLIELHQEGTARIETATGEEVIPLKPAHVTNLYKQVALEADWKYFEVGEVEKAASATAAGDTDAS